MKKILLLFTIAVLSFMSCDYVVAPNQVGTVTVPLSDTVRKIFIEDFTGHTCPNCPTASRMLDSLGDAYPTQIIGMGVHIDYYAEPCPPHQLPSGATPGTFSEDFRVAAEDADYDLVFGSNSFGLPTGLVNRYGFPTSFPTAVTAWPSTVATILAQPMTAYIKIIPSYNTSSRNLSVNVTGNFMVDTTGTYNIALYLVESEIIGSQTDITFPAPGIDNNFKFNHVFRGCINTPGIVTGETINSGSILNNTPINYSTTNTYTVNPLFVDTHCKIIAILYKTSDYGVLQAAEVDLR